MASGNSRMILWPKGWLLFYSIVWILVAVGIGLKASSILVLLSALGFAVVASLLFFRCKLAIPANIVFSVYLIGLGGFTWYQIGRPGYLIGAIFCLASTWIFRDELAKQV